jgi:hypothetical protein
MFFNCTAKKIATLLAIECVYKTAYDALGFLKLSLVLAIVYLD